MPFFMRGVGGTARRRNRSTRGPLYDNSESQLRLVARSNGLDSPAVLDPTLFAMLKEAADGRNQEAENDDH